MITIKNYVKAQTLEEAFRLNQSKRNCILGGMLWLRTGKKSVDTAIDLSDLGLNTIEDTDGFFRIGAMTTLRQLETSEALNSFFGNTIRKSVENIVGVQFRNLATVGGSIWGRYGFSDVLTVFLSLDSYVELYQGGIIKLEDFIRMPKDNDILVRLLVKKTPGFYTYDSVRIQRTDFPVLTCSVSAYDGDWYCTVGARPAMAVKIKDSDGIMKAGVTAVTIQRFADYAAEKIETGTNMRGGKEYRKQLIRVLAERNLSELEEAK